MDNIEYSVLSNSIINGLENSISKGGEIDLFGNKLTLANIQNVNTYVKNNENFIIVLFKHKWCGDFYKAVVHIRRSKNPNFSTINIQRNLVEDVKTYLEEGLTDRLQAEANTHYEYLTLNNMVRAPFLEYPIVLDDILPNTYRLQTPTGIINSVSEDTAYRCSKLYCKGTRDPEIVGVVKKLESVLTLHRELYIREVVTKYNKTGCIIKSITHGIEKILPRPVRIHDLEKGLWENMLLSTTEEIRNYHIRFPIPPTAYILREVTANFRGGSSFSVVDLAAGILGYRNMETVDLVLQAVSIMYPDPVRNYFKLYF